MQNRTESQGTQNETRECAQCGRQVHFWTLMMVNGRWVRVCLQCLQTLLV